jgi:TolB-like protein
MTNLDMVGIAASIAVAPFENLSGNPDEEYFARGFVEDVATELSRFAHLEVLYPRAVASALRGRGADAREVAMADHLLRGSIRRARDVIRIAVQLVETKTGRQMWAERYDATAPDLLAVQDEIAARIAATLASHLAGERLARARRAPLANLEVYDCWLRGLACLHTGTVEADAEARRFFERALEIDPGYARAYTGLSLSHFNEWSCQAWEKWDEKERLAYEYAQRAAALDDSDAVVQVMLGRILLYRRRFDEASYHVDRALALNANDTNVLVHAGLARAYLGDPDSALELGSKAMRLHPTCPPWYAAPAWLGLFMLGRNAEAIELGARMPGALFVDTAAFVGAAWALAGDVERARTYLKRFLDEFRERVTFGRDPEPGEPLRWMLHVNPFRREEDVARLTRGLHAAGLEDDPDEGRPEAVARPTASRASRATFRQEGGLWTMAFDGFVVQLTPQKGFADLARLLQQPGVEIHCLELADRPLDSGADAVLDERARREIQARVRELQREIDDAEAANDLGRAEKSREELDRIVELLSGALGLRGRSRTLGSAAERARSAVTWRIRSAIRKTATVHPRLGRHLENAVRTGTFCVYRPETAIDWTV